MLCSGTLSQRKVAGGRSPCTRKHRTVLGRVGRYCCLPVVLLLRFVQPRTPRKSSAPEAQRSDSARKHLWAERSEAAKGASARGRPTFAFRLLRQGDQQTALSLSLCGMQDNVRGKRQIDGNGTWLGALPDLCLKLEGPEARVGR